MLGRSAFSVDLKYPRLEPIDPGRQILPSRLSDGIAHTLYSGYGQSWYRLEEGISRVRYSWEQSFLTQRPVLPVPDSNCLIIGTRDDPGKLMMEEHCANIIQMTIQREQTSASLI
jgi:hypothetical protein